MNAIINGKIILEDKILENHVLIYEKKILDIVPNEEFEQKDKKIIDAKDNFVSPGFIDIHIHGSSGCDTMDGDINSINTISETILKNGVTSFLPTTMTMDLESIYNALDTVRESMTKELNGAKVLGAHMEGPFINPKYKGAQKEEYIIKPEYDSIEKYMDVIKLITYAPERDENFNFLENVIKNESTTLSIGHTEASYEQAMEAIKRGASHSTHMFNAMTGLHHRNPGVVGAIMDSDISTEIIADNIHLHNAIYNIAYRLKGPDKLVLITDAMRAACLKSGSYDLGGQEVIVKDNAARLEDGTLAGSVLRLNQAVKNMYDNTELPLYECVKLASLNPSKVININNERGSLEKNKYADIIIFDEQINIINAIVEGESKHENY
ncbi:N-acetylglucosamine-6-phosphate deacetylase [Senegalia massiliensis]|uniref:N-acetylglucosamine-6-phosphate deacetylase n=1 Tax=Senegalia massiliensis TaxID=1720316 RepID=A0A845QXL9_9CLOT|nr:N-acetylglucosamine-6-phosphate deacetylase [Senegalia massiliensis]NBI07021.1 N-acetylglucosamine-6-phosphate deacetylase [Senegalia massiliensis]